MPRRKCSTTWTFEPCSQNSHPPVHSGSLTHGIVFWHLEKPPYRRKQKKTKTEENRSVRTFCPGHVRQHFFGRGKPPACPLKPTKKTKIDQFGIHLPTEVFRDTFLLLKETCPSKTKHSHHHLLGSWVGGM